jgi:Ca2+-binding EF-hand superfamily protein
MIPSDPNILLGFLNLKLRDYYSSFDLLCEDLNINKSEIEEKMRFAGYEYKQDRNQFA